MHRSSTADDGPRWQHVALAAAILLSIAYANGLDAAFVFDDEPSIRDNESIRRLWPPWRAVWTPGGTGRTHDGRPLVNLSFAISYALHGLWRPGLRIGNLLIHLANVCLVFAITRRLLALAAATASRAADGGRCRWLAAAIAIVWAVHPLHTNVVTYIVQRAESLAATFMLGSFLLAMRGLDGGRFGAVIAAVVVAAAAGLVKETTVAILPIVAAFDWAFRDRFAIRSDTARLRHLRYILYGGLAANPLVLATVAWCTGGRGTSAGFGSAPVLPYVLTQCQAFWVYLGVIFWPDSLVLDRGRAMTPLAAAWPALLATLGAIAAIAVGAWKRPRTWFAAVAGCFLLAPSSSVIPIATQTIAEHRVYLASATVLGLAITGAARVLSDWRLVRPRVGVVLAWCLMAVIVTAAVVRTAARNRDFATPFSLWTQNMRARPDNPRGLENLTASLRHAGRYAEAADLFRRSLAVPELRRQAACGLGDMLIRLDDWPGAQQAYLQAVAEAGETGSEEFHALAGLACCHVRLGRPHDALQIVRLMADPAWGDTPMPADKRQPAIGRALACRAVALLRLGPDAQAEATRARAAAIAHAGAHPDAAEAMARCFDDLREFPAAATVWEPLAAADPALLPNLAASRWEAGQLEEAITAFRAAADRFPDDAGTIANAARALALSGRHREALPLFDRALRLGRAAGNAPPVLNRWEQERSRSASALSAP